MRVAVLIPAAGASARYAAALGSPRSKLDEDLGGRPVLHRTVELFANYEHPDLTLAPLIVAGPADPDAFAEFKLRHGDKLAILGVTLCPGGQTHRYETVREALSHVPPDATHVAVHDAARPCASRELLDRVFDAATKHPAVIPSVPVSSTLRVAGAQPLPDEDDDPVAAILGAESKGPPRYLSEGTIARERVHAAQTPQVFAADLLQRAYAQDDLTSTDDAELVERLGESVVLVEGDPANLKITHPIDLTLARAALGLRAAGDRPTHKRF